MSFFNDDIDNAFSGEMHIPTLPRARTSSRSDRFVPQRSSQTMAMAQLRMSSNENAHPNVHLMSPSKEAYKQAVVDTMFDTSAMDCSDRSMNPSNSNAMGSFTMGNNMNHSANTNLSTSTHGGYNTHSSSSSSKILRFKCDAPAPREGYQNELRVLYSHNVGNNALAGAKKTTRVIPQAPIRVLDAPELLDDYYLNLLDWNKDNLLAIALGQSVYVWNASSGEVSQLMSTSAPDDYIASVSWVADGPYLAIGTQDAQVQIYDVERCKMVRTMGGHSSRVSALSWNNHIVSSGGRDTMILNHDVRISQHLVATMQHHTQEVCGLKWSPDGLQLASGGNDNVLNIWNANSVEAPAFSLTEHQAAVKALDWCPWQRNLLASGGGTADRTIRFWNTANGTCINSIDTKSQVCSLKWSREYKEIVSSHGFSQNQLTVWKYPTMTKVAELTGHTSRVLHMAMSPDGTTVASAAADESLRIWQVFAPSESKSLKVDEQNSVLSGINIR
eukprot:TRINITY_DN7180_c0_g1_i2.p1 TRINITY_DN7180_c0_g1~~TRINITY_DN7180_c0_g1_i2.p1  ORF type:complete len:501 (+),score=97.83 TRINITY_DN7180_c0_g1_i2:269-1771(+)